MSELGRRDWIKTAGGTGAAGALAGFGPKAHAGHHGEQKFKFCLNMSTIRGQGLDAAQEIDVAGKAGYDSIEPWFGKIDEYVQNGGSL
ncbi:MAG: sugar phosphate isomerase/epimerase, partial [Verrucomicrobiota bacterium]